MRKTRAFTLIELLVVISIIALLIGILLPALGAARRTARQMQNSTQVRGIHQACIIFAQGNNTWYPGLNRDGASETGHTFRVGSSTQTLSTTDPNQTTSASVGYRFRRLLEDNHFAGAYAISPSETKKNWSTGPVVITNYSYGMLERTTTPQRYNEWRQTNNAEAPVLGDRLVANGTGTFKSVHTNPKSTSTTEWRGSVAWNDNHVSFEPDFTVDTKYGRKSTASDNLFTEVSNTDGTNNPHNAWLIYSSTNASL